MSLLGRSGKEFINQPVEAPLLYYSYSSVIIVIVTDSLYIVHFRWGFKRMFLLPVP